MVENAMWRRVRAIGKGKPKYFSDKMYCVTSDSMFRIGLALGGKERGR